MDDMAVRASIFEIEVSIISLAIAMDKLVKLKEFELESKVKLMRPDAGVDAVDEWMIVEEMWAQRYAEKEVGGE